ncbi:MAG TPA: hypothetical protein DEG17_24950 [Cyanobacteria bacterium UBA11149]|nr:hypothetical protein [Cyanobacteria bacterium UBA11367]HBE58462.1 hypothetical protein [Cyanobacteria bacterium UBA11366]HBK62749.1 hypothetical protein [Cyanobacteria bacterium UBA11166]HBR73489.1 hypothetical protein [Cyanobacteria bacterium UBA11159]HBS71822.1 hypothetical protein [Cyanobacteria bacterium UBA11153]HBW92028.1 hypothetical protein [Cyanobacteria bacterium UBA11149]HCA94250.1 hypothetical protein [Cyanobacteria bacterium UBA9226]
MKDCHIVQIVPRLPPYTDGVGDYSLRLAESLRKNHRISTYFIVFQQGIEIPPVIQGFSATGLLAYDSDTLLSVLPENTQAIILHYSNYPYIKEKFKGPFWLPKALEAIVNLRQIKLIVMFYELPFLKYKQIEILNPIQASVSRRLAKIANDVLTNCGRFQKIISQWTKSSVTNIPVFSNIPEPTYIPPLVKRERRTIVFGTTARHRLYKNHLKELIQLCHILEIKEIYDIGQPLNLDCDNFAGVKVIEMGFQPHEIVSELMLNSLVGCLDYTKFPGQVGKSGVFAAYCAHGLTPILSKYNPSQVDKLECKKHYLVLGNQMENITEKDLQLVADNAYSWYQNHNVTETANLFASLIIN